MPEPKPEPPELALDDLIAEWIYDIIRFVRECFEAEPDAWQADTLIAFLTNQRIAMKASKGPGKSCVLAWIAWFFLVTRPDCRVFATSISKENLSDGLWTEMNKWYLRSPLLQKLFEYGKTRISHRQRPDKWYMSARTWSRSATKEQQGQTLAGLHDDYMLFLIDEAGGIPDAVAATAEAGLSTGIEVKIVIAGNPTHLTGPLYRACTKERSMWWIKEISGDPDLPDGHPNRAPRVLRKWAREEIQRWGRDNPYVKVNVFGEFPEASPNALFGPNEVSAGMSRHLDPDMYNFSEKRLGVDVARFGDDLSCIFPRQGLASFKPVILRKQRSTFVAGRTIKAMIDWQCEWVAVDASGGHGAGVCDVMHMAGHVAHEVQFGGDADDPTFFDKRSENWWRMAEWLKRGAALPNDTRLVEELTGVQYDYFKGKIRLEEKAHMKARLGYSPDMGDALSCTFQYEDAPAVTKDEAMLEMLTGQGKAKIDPGETVEPRLPASSENRGRTYLDRGEMGPGKVTIDIPEEE